MNEIGYKTPEYKGTPMPPVKPAAPCESITIPLAEYIYLQRVDALMDALLQADNYNNTQVVASIKDAVKAMRNPGAGGAEQ